ncbi:actin-related protein ARPC5 [Sanghuangporus baumii]|uniref:Actin-related protein 2/3 complex subunit 5 n=1 Tax=Sanghuangporus baumii TaxID=108892 RepID=A0A9Q5I2R2_SANBA|nr:actin-related protein ARPC5 [Sanghuangporus baumii]
METAFRKIDIDKYDEDVLLEEELYEPDPRDPAQVLADTRAKATTVRSFLAKDFLVTRGDAAGALNIVLDGAPYGPNVEEAKNTNLQTLLTILGSTKVPEIPGILKSLSQDTQDTLMKYLYKGMAMPSWGDSSWSVFLAWHEKLTEIAGIGCIVRVMTDRRTV